ncbi:MAG: rhomboid family intramembrane serine protease [Spirochaetia bacterium]|nr:rhomboid family intramembrane serine protease [Spirochaetia bacterium]MCE1209166.1 rhomboid family intramembrane serine protease [Spirochaetia bacterium]NLX45991.1 rhomboid family intramembrane serine protease [Treponema sp.]HOI23231.1 rhomboid family intramembrane serine protease [Spirochaetales bacterium]
MPALTMIRKPFRYSYFNATLYLIAANILFFALGYVFPLIKVYMALNPAALLSGFVWQILSYMFAHADISHLLVNMLGLFIFGTAVERSMGSKEFLLFYLLTGTLAGITSFGIYVATGSWYTMLLGSSGAVYALLLAFAVLNPEARIFLYGILPVRAPILVLGYAGIEIASQLFSFRSSVAHLTHLAGFFWSWLYFVLRFGINPAKRLFGPR